MYVYFYVMMYELYIITKEMSKVDDYQDDYWHPGALSKLSNVSKDLKLQ